MFRFLAFVEALFLLAAAWIYVGSFTVMGFVMMLGAYHGIAISLVVLAAMAAVACVTMAIFLVNKPRRNLMISGAILILPACVLIPWADIAAPRLL